MSSSFHTYPEFESDVRTSMDTLASQAGLPFERKGSMPCYGNEALELRFAMDMQRPELYLQLKGHQLMTIAQVLDAAGIPSPQPQGTSPRERALSLLQAWRTALTPLLPRLSLGDISDLKLPAVDEAAYALKLRTYVTNNAPIGHIARQQLWKEDWKVHAEAFLKASGGKLD